MRQKIRLMNASSADRNKVRQSLFRKLKRENAFWSYNQESVTLRNCDDDTLIYNTLVHLDIEEISQLFSIYDKVKIQEVWERELCIQGNYYRRLNNFLAFYFFNIDDPKKYIRKIERNHLKSIIQKAEQKE